VKRNILVGLTLAASLLGASAASAQVIYVDQRGGDRARYERDWDRDHRRDRDRGEYRRFREERHSWDRGHHRGWGAEPILVRRGDRDRYECRDITVRKYDRWGNPVVKHIRKCG